VRSPASGLHAQDLDLLEVERGRKRGVAEEVARRPGEEGRGERGARAGEEAAADRRIPARARPVRGWAPRQRASIGDADHGGEQDERQKTRQAARAERARARAPRRAGPAIAPQAAARGDGAVQARRLCRREEIDMKLQNTDTTNRLNTLSPDEEDLRLEPEAENPQFAAKNA